jgi:hypothetical protein
MEWWVGLPAVIGAIIPLPESSGQHKAEKAYPVRNDKKKKEVTMIFNFRKRSLAKAGVFNGSYIDARVFYAWMFREVPCMAFIGDLDVAAALQHLKTHDAGDIVDTYQYNHFDHSGQKLYFVTTIVVLANKRMIVFGCDYIEMLHTCNDYHWCAAMASIFAVYRKDVSVHTPVIGFSVTSAMN